MWIYRGQGDARYDLSTSLARRILSKARGYSPERLLALEHNLTKAFRSGAGLHYASTNMPTNTLSWWAEMQHYGMPTRLLDFTWSPYIAAYFAMEDGSGERDRAVWALRMDPQMQIVGHNERITSFLLEEFGDEVREMVQSGDVWEDAGRIDAFLKAAQARRLRALITIQTDCMNDRMFGQQGVFVMPASIDVSFMQCLAESGISGHAETPESPVLMKVVIPGRCRLDALTNLLRMNVTRASLFPGLEGFARTLGDNFERALESHQI